MEEYKDDEDKPWDLETIRKGLKKFVTAQEAGERQMNFNTGHSSNDSQNEKPLVENQGFKRPYSPRYTTGALHTGSRPRSCIYCSENHWSDECKSYSDVESRKKRLHGRCFICFGSHMLKDCPSKKECVYCKMKSNHHRSLCTKQFPRQNEVKVPSLKVVEGSSVAVGEQVIMQTASVTLMNLDDELIQRKSRLLLDCGSQRTYITKYLAEKLKLKEVGKSCLVVYTFGTNKPENIETPVVELGLRLNSGFTMHLKANVVPVITGKIQRVLTC